MKNKAVKLEKITGNQINGEMVSCTGLQFVLLINSLAKQLENCYWYIADISAVGGLLPSTLVENSASFIKVGKTQELVQLVGQIEQLASGIFLAIPESILEPDLSGDFNTESDPTEDLGDAVLEIRALDTSYFEVYYSEYLLLEASRKN
jgi:hypothetical protein